ncbi:hypothetical protein Gpo141_00013609 [Globisporangium polare]
MLLQRLLCVASLLFLQAAAPVRALSDTSVCSFTTGNLYVRDASQTAFPPGFLSCLGAGNQPIARCSTCKCRDKQSASSGGKTVEWGLCIEGTEACVTSQTPDREYCGNDTESGRVFQPGTVTGANTDATTVSTPLPTSSGGVNELASNNGIAKSSSKSATTNAYIVGGCAVAGVAAIAMFAVARKQKNESRELGTPMQDPATTDRAGGGYGNNNTSKANNMLSASTVSYKNRLSERMSGESMLGDDSFQHSSDAPMPAPVPTNGRFIHQQQQQQQQKQRYESEINQYGAPPSYAAVASNQTAVRPAPADSEMRESSFFGSEFDERFTIDDNSVPERSGFESIAYGQANQRPNFESSFMSVTANGFDSSFASMNDFEATHVGGDNHNHHERDLGESMFDGRNTSLSVESDGLTMYDRDTAASEFLRESDDSVTFSTSSLSFCADEASPRNRDSIEF